MANVKTHSLEIGGKNFTFESGKLAQQADGSVLCNYGEISVLACATMGGAREGIDFFPLVVDFEAKFYAAGKIKGSRFNKREGRASAAHTLVARMIDRPIRPLFPKGMTNEVQIINTLLQADTEHCASAAAITATSMALQLSGIPFECPIAGVRVGIDENGAFILDPTFDQQDNGDLDLLVAGSADSIMMVEAGANLISDEKMLEALEFAHTHIKTLCTAQAEFLKEFDIEAKEPTFQEANETGKELVQKLISESDFDAISGTTKKEVKKQLKAIEEKVLETYATQIETEEVTEKELKQAVDKLFGESQRRRILEQGKRVDNRTPEEIRPIYVETGLFPRVHGSGLFQRGETQVLNMLTIGGPGDEEIIDDPDRPEFTNRYIHHYNFPPYSVGEVRMMRGPGRREIGHGALAERALRYVIPTEEADQFPYMLRAVSEVLACNGSSSMASVCGSTLSLMDGGIPIKSPISGIAMGLVIDEETGNYKILSDIQGLEDAGGDMDFKVTGNADGITALQMDIKVKGLSLDLLREALAQAKAGRTHILKAMTDVIAEPKADMSPYAPRVYTTQVDVDDIKIVIGKGGETIQAMQKDFNVDISVAENGVISITAESGEGADLAIKAIKAITYRPEIGDIIEEATVRNITDFGAFVQIAPGKDALLHISDIAQERVNNVGDYLKEGEKVKVKVTEIDRQGRIKVSRKVLL